MSGESAYKAAGVDIDAQDSALDQIKDLVRSTNNDLVLSEIGNFGGLFKLPLEGLEEPVLVASADGVGTKLTVAKLAGDYRTVGRDLVNHCVNDILVQGARPLFFMDYVGAGVLEPAAMVDLISGVVVGCRENNSVLLGGETAEMPGMYDPGEYELVGFIVGIADRSKILDGSRIREGDLLLGLPSAGLHTNGFSLARHVLFETMGLSLDSELPGAGRSVKEELLRPHLSYLACLKDLLLDDGLHALAHITGGGLTDNIPRVLPKGLEATIDPGAWQVPSVFQLIQQHGRVSSDEMFRVFNMGVGMVLVVDPAQENEVVAELARQGQGVFRLGTVRDGDGGVVYL